MRADLDTLKNYVAKIEKEHQELFITYLNYLLNFRSKRNVPRAYNTIYFDLTTAVKYSYSIKFDYTQINTITVSAYLEKKKDKGDYYAKIGIFVDFLLQQKIIDETIKTKLFSNNHFKNPITSFKEKKYAIPQHKWIDLYSQLSGVRKFALWFLFHTGVRVGELITLETKDIIIDEQQGEYKVIIHPHADIGFYPKTESSIREIPLRKQEITIIKQFLKARGLHHISHDYLIYNTRKTIHERVKVETTIEHWLGEVLYYDETPKENFICKYNMKSRGTKRKQKHYTPKCYEVFPNAKSHRHITPHLCRYSFASNIYYKGKDQGVDLLNEVSKLLGHANSEITFQYLQLDKKDQQQRTLNALEIAYQ